MSAAPGMGAGTATGTATGTAIILPHYNDVARLTRCLEALRPQLGPGVEAIVVDNDSTADLDGLRAVWAPNLRLVTETRKGAAHARNRGVTETGAERLFFLDSDCVPGPDWVDTAQRVADRADLVGGTVTVFDETPAPRTGAEAFETVFAFDNRDYIVRKGFSVTANLLTTRRVFDAVGGFRPGLSEDLDWCRRATGAGFTLTHEAGLKVAHPTRSDWPALVRKWRRLTQESWGLKGRGPVDRIRWAITALAMIPSIAVHTPRVLRHPDLSGTTERLRGLGTLARIRMQRCVWMLRQALGLSI